ncbi:MAG TPA: hypothetical protein VGR62_03485 [Candidatus Binatia bacterium]|jgi:nucleoside phosphorylase|nr:hypothetical protein [Candidatus Binatia bacterium]
MRVGMIAAAVLLGGTVAVAADPMCSELAGPCAAPPYVLVVTAFPGETTPVLARTELVETVTVDRRTFYVGRMAGVPVVVVRGGIGLRNAAATTRAALERFELSAIVFSGVAGSRYDIADVVVPAEWTDGTDVFPADPTLLAAMRSIGAPSVELASCTPVPPDPPGPEVCLGRTPRILVGGRGESSDPYGDDPFACAPGAGAVLGCEEAIHPAAMVRAAADEVYPDAVDMETAAVARVAAEAGVPFIGVRGVSDGNGDPLDLGPFPGQFFAYYAIAAENAAVVTEALVDVAAGDDVPGASGHLGTGAACDWVRAADAACAGVQAPPGVTRRVATACRMLDDTSDPRVANRLRKTWKRAASTVGRTKKIARACRSALAQALRSRAVTP